jgi:hypothetical protein
VRRRAGGGRSCGGGDTPRHATRRRRKGCRYSNGRAARAEFDLDPIVHVRVETALSAATLAQALFDRGVGDPTCGSLETRYGRIDEIRLDGAEAEFHIARVPPRMAVDRDRDLVRGTAVGHADYEALAARARGV